VLDSALQFGRHLFHTQIVVQSLTFAIKTSVRRQRPDHSNNRAFPSGHASTTFAAATVLDRHYGWRVAVPAYVMASYVSASRLRANRHVLSDVMFGAAVGVWTGRAVPRRHTRAGYSWTPTPVPGGVAVFVTRIQPGLQSSAVALRLTFGKNHMEFKRGDATMSVEVGAKAPDFTLPNQDREPVTLSEQVKRGPVVLAFFPAAFSGTCTTEMCTFRDSAATLNKVGATVLGVSVDTFFALKAWGDAQKLNFPLLSDFNKDVMAKYGVVNPDMIGLKGIAKRSIFVIDRGGVVRHREVLEDARNEPNYDTITQTLATL